MNLNVFDNLFNYGVPAILVAFCMWGAVRITRFLAPYLKKFFDANIGLIESMKDSQKTYAEILTNIEQTQQKQTQHLGRVTEIQKKHIEISQQILEVVENHDHDSE